MPQGYVKPANRVLIDDLGGSVIREFEVGANATAAKMLPGNAVIVDTLADAVKECGDKAAKITGVLEIGPINSLTTAYAIADQCRVLTGHFIAQIRLKASENVSIDDRLVCAADGQFKKLAVGVIGAQGAIVARALEASNVTTVAYIMAEVNTAAMEQTTAS